MKKGLKNAIGEVKNAGAMDRLVCGFAKINFQQNCEDILTENQEQNLNCDGNKPTLQAPATLAAPAILHLFAQTQIPMTAAKATTQFSINKLDLQMTSSNEDMDEHTQSSEEEEADGRAADGHDAAHTSTARFSQRRNMPSRSCKENSLSKTKRRSIMKPTKRIASRTTEFSAMRPADIKKIYLNKKLTNFRPANLETIFEEPQPTTPDAATESQVRFVGLRKMRRSLSCSDGFNINKNLIKQRRAKIKKTFGRRFALKKISLQDFIEHLNKSFEGENQSDVESNATTTTIATSSNFLSAVNAMDADTVMNANYSGTNHKTASMQSLQEFDLVETVEDNYDEAGILKKSNSFSGACFTTATKAAKDDITNHIHDDIALV